MTSVCMSTGYNPQGVNAQNKMNVLLSSIKVGLPTSLQILLPYVVIAVRICDCELKAPGWGRYGSD